MFAGIADMGPLRQYDDQVDCDGKSLQLQTLLLRTVQELHSRGCRRFICPIDEPFGFEAAHAVLMARETGGKTCRNIVLKAFALSSEPHPEFGATARFLFEDILRSSECDAPPNASETLSREQISRTIYRILEEKLLQCAFLVCFGEQKYPPLHALAEQAETAGIEVIRLDRTSSRNQAPCDTNDDFPTSRSGGNEIA